MTRWDAVLRPGFAFQWTGDWDAVAAAFGHGARFPLSADATVLYVTTGESEPGSDGLVKIESAEVRLGQWVVRDPGARYVRVVDGR